MQFNVTQTEQIICLITGTSRISSILIRFPIDSEKNLNKHYSQSRSRRWCGRSAIILIEDGTETTFRAGHES